MQAQIASGELATAAGKAGRAYIDRKNQERADKEYEIRKAAALKKAKDDGVLPEEFQKTVPEDKLGQHVGVKVIALRELAKLDPNHPLVTYKICQDVVANLTLREFNRKDRNVTYKDSAPAEETTKKLFDKYRVDSKTTVVYKKALEQAKTTGKFPAALQKQVPLDQYIGQVGLIKALQDELRKLNPFHPLVTSQECRDSFRNATVVSYNEKNRPENIKYVECAPTGAAAQKILERYQIDVKKTPNYLAALEEAKVTGKFPASYQPSVPVDWYLKRCALFMVAVSELGALDRNHPLAENPEKTWEAIGTSALIEYNKTDRADTLIYRGASPAESVLDELFGPYKKARLKQS